LRALGRAAAARVRGALGTYRVTAVPRVEPVTAIALAVGAIAAAGGYFAIDGYADARLQREFDDAAGDVASFLGEAIDRHVGAAENAGGLLGGAEVEVSRWAFFEFVRALPDRHPATAALAWLPRVDAARRGVYEGRARADGLFDFRFTEPGADGAPVPARRRAEYFPVYYVEPYPGNEAMLGVDAAAAPDGSALLARLRDGGAASAVATAPLFGLAAGISVVAPVFRTKVVPFTVAERRDALAGFVRADLRFDRLLDALVAGLGRLPDLDVAVRVAHGDRAPAAVFAFASRDGAIVARGIDGDYAADAAAAAFDREAAGASWRILVTPVRGTLQTTLWLTAWGFVAFTLLLTALLLRHLATMRRARDRAEAANRAKSEFLAMMGHELRTPLNAVIGFSEMMVNELFGPQSNDHYRQYTTHIHRSARHLLEMINTILDMAKVEAGSYELAEETFALAEIWAGVRPALDGAIDKAGVAFADEIAATTLVLHADPHVFRQVLTNLASNAVKFTPAGGRVTVGARVDAAGRLVLCVADTGIGIAEADLELVLKPFRQADSTLARKYEGTGLGLPLTQRLVALQGGELRIDSRPGEGTEATVTFPPRIIVADAAAAAEPPPEREYAHAV
jgi:signal transduction histidine kinase